MKAYYNDWKIVYFNQKENKVKYTKCFCLPDEHEHEHVYKHDHNNIYDNLDIKQFDNEEFVFDLVEEEERCYFFADYLYLIPANILELYGQFKDKGKEEEDVIVVNFDDLLEYYLFFQTKQARVVYNIVEKGKKEYLFENDKLCLFFKAHVYHIDTARYRSQIKQPYGMRGFSTVDNKDSVKPGLAGNRLTGAPSISISAMFIDEEFISIRFTNIPIYIGTQRTYQVLSSNQPFDTPEPLINNDINLVVVEEKEEEEKEEKKTTTITNYAPLHNICDVVIDVEDMKQLNGSFMFSDNVLHKTIRDIVDDCDNSFEMMKENINVFVSNINTTTQLRLIHTPFDSNRTDPMNFKKQVQWIFDERISDYCTYVDIEGKLQSSLVSKDFLFFPVNSISDRGAHWALYMCYKPFDRKEKSCMIYIIDSLFDADRKVGVITYEEHILNVLKLRHYLTLVADRYIPHLGGSQLVIESRPSHILRIPQQPYGSNACGLYISIFISAFLRMTEQEKQDFMKVVTGSLDKNNKELFKQTLMVDEYAFFNRDSMAEVKEAIVSKFDAICCYDNVLPKKIKMTRNTI